MIYLDSCALVKLVRVEDHSEALQAWLDDRADERVLASELAVAEVNRTIRRVNHDGQGRLIDPDALARELAEAADVLAGVEQLVVDLDVLRRAGDVQEPMIRTLDAVHLVSALLFPVAEIRFVTYDRQLAAAARGAGLVVVAPHSPVDA